MSIFISYRRGSTIDITGRIHDRLAAHFGAEQVFRDVDGIPLGTDFRQILLDEVLKRDVFLAIVGGDYFEMRRVANPDDFVRIEIEAALRSDALIIPVLVGKGALPKKSKLPRSIARIVDFQAMPVGSGREFDGNVHYLIEQISEAHKLAPTRKRRGASDPDPKEEALDKRPTGRWKYLFAAVFVAALAFMAARWARQAPPIPQPISSPPASLNGTRWRLVAPGVKGPTIELKASPDNSQTYVGQVVAVPQPPDEASYLGMLALWLVSTGTNNEYAGVFQASEGRGKLVARSVRVKATVGNLNWDFAGASWERDDNPTGQRAGDGAGLPPQGYFPGTKPLARNDLVAGIDISRFDREPDWKSLAARGYRFVFMKASEGLRADASFSRNWKAAGQAGLVRGAYHFYRAEVDTSAQADFFLQTVSLKFGDLPAVLDLELLPEGVSTTDLAFRMAKWLAIVEDKMGRKPIFYGRALVAKHYPDLQSLSSYPLWTAQYTTSAWPGFPANWSTWTFWQWSDGRNPERLEPPCDHDYFNGRTEDFARFLGVPVTP